MRSRSVRSIPGTVNARSPAFIPLYVETAGTQKGYGPGRLFFRGPCSHQTAAAVILYYPDRDLGLFDSPVDKVAGSMTQTDQVGSRILSSLLDPESSILYPRPMKKLIPVSLGLRVKTGRAIAVLLHGPAAA